MKGTDIVCTAAPVVSILIGILAPFALIFGGMAWGAIQRMLTDKPYMTDDDEDDDEFEHLTVHYRKGRPSRTEVTPVSRYYTLPFWKRRQGVFVRKGPEPKTTKWSNLLWSVLAVLIFGWPVVIFFSIAYCN